MKRSILCTLLLLTSCQSSTLLTEGAPGPDFSGDPGFTLAGHNKVRPTPRPSPTPTPKPSPTPRPSPTPKPSPTPSPKPSPTPTASPSPSPTVAPSPTPSPSAQIQFSLDSSHQVKPISPYIYGYNSADWASAPAGLTLNRLGGNRWSAYNWETNYSNAGSDWYHHNDNYLAGSGPAGAVLGPARETFARNAAMLVTVPITGYAAADAFDDPSAWGPRRVLWDAQLSYLTTRFRTSLPRKASAFGAAPDTGDGFVYQDEFVHYLETSLPDRSGQKQLFYSLDNEPDLWAYTHPLLRAGDPLKGTDTSVSGAQRVGYAELVQRSRDYAAAIKSQAPNGRVFGYVGYGYNGFINLQDAPDKSNGLFLDYFLAGMNQASQSAGKRLLDVLDVHWYPETYQNIGRFCDYDDDNGNTAMRDARMQSPRSLWDPAYREPTWIGDYHTAVYGQNLQLLRWLKSRIDAKYPGTDIGITEYFYGGGNVISGGITQADVLGVFGREGVFAASLWPMRSARRYIDAAFAMYRNYDAQGAHFGNTGFEALSPDPANVPIYASYDAGQPAKVVLVLINKRSTSLTSSVQLTHPVALQRARVFTLTQAASAPVRQADLLASGPNRFNYTLPPLSVTTLELSQ